VDVVKMPFDEAVSRVHYELIQSLIKVGACPTRSELAERLNMPVVRIEQLLSELSQVHGVVLHPHLCEPWLVHPFSTTPTAHWVEAGDGDWWAPCIWCAFGIATLVGGDTRIHTRFGAESETLVIRTMKGIRLVSRRCGSTSPFRPVAPGKMSTSIARWFSLSVHRKTFSPGAIATDCRMEKMFVCTMSCSLPECGMAHTQMRTGISGRSPRRKRFSSSRDLFRRSGILVRKKADTKHTCTRVGRV
jgi:Alkylmercury lyase